MLEKYHLSKTCLLHYFKLLYRSALLITAVVLYVIDHNDGMATTFAGIENMPILLLPIWIIFAVEMILRFFSFQIESMGCQKQFEKNFKPYPKGAQKAPVLQKPGITFLVLFSWLGLNTVFGILFYLGIIDKGILVLLSLAYSVCDMICILFFCPFQTWFMKNKCCATCRIYNWDYAMMFTPLVFFYNPLTWSLLALALALLIKWELLLHLHPERFSVVTNVNLSCVYCTEKLCHHKKSLQGFLTRHKEHGWRMPEWLKQKQEYLKSLKDKTLGKH